MKLLSPYHLFIPKECVWNAKCTGNTWKPTGPKRPRQVSRQVKRGYPDLLPQEAIAAMTMPTQISLYKANFIIFQVYCFLNDKICDVFQR